LNAGDELFFDKKDSETYRIIGLIGSFGFTTAGAIAGGYFLGSYIDRKLDTSPWFLMSLIILGIVASFIEFFKLVKKFIGENKKRQ
jgi:F0F1-type ATP synthase assembly protein I